MTKSQNSCAIPEPRKKENKWVIPRQNDNEWDVMSSENYEIWFVGSKTGFEKYHFSVLRNFDF